MRSGLLQEEHEFQEAEWWLDYRKEINFAFRVMASLGLVESDPLTGGREAQDEIEKEVEKIEDTDPDRFLIYDAKPTAALMSLYRKEYRRLLAKRDQNITVSFYHYMTKDWGK
jgi:hypothetical protein